MPILDTTFLIDLDRGLDEARTALAWAVDRGEDLVVPAQTATEYISGFDDPVANLSDLERSFRVVPYGRDHIVETARLVRLAYEKGAFPGWADAQIASVAWLEGEPVLTANQDHFRALGCRVWDYRNDPEGPAPN